MAYYKEGRDEPPLTGKGSKLTNKMTAFVDAYMVNMNGSKAVISANYKTANPNRMASELLNHPLVKREIERRLEKKREKFALDESYVLMKLRSIVEDTEEGNPQAALRGLELIGKHLGMYKERQEISGPDGNAIQMEQKVKENVKDFTSRISSLAKRSGTGEVVKFPDGTGEE